MLLALAWTSLRIPSILSSSPWRRSDISCRRSCPNSDISFRRSCPNSDISFRRSRSEEHTSELQSPCNLVCRLLLETNKLTDLVVFLSILSITQGSPWFSYSEQSLH